MSERKGETNLSKIDAKVEFGHKITRGRGRESRPAFARRLGIQKWLLDAIEHGEAPYDKGPVLVRIIYATHLSLEEKDVTYDLLKQFCSNCSKRKKERRKIHLPSYILFTRKPNRQGRWLGN